jgi:hypothetical protein
MLVGTVIHSTNANSPKYTKLTTDWYMLWHMFIYITIWDRQTTTCSKICIVLHTVTKRWQTRTWATWLSTTAVTSSHVLTLERAKLRWIVRSTVSGKPSFEMTRTSGLSGQKNDQMDRDFRHAMHEVHTALPHRCGACNITRDSLYYNIQYGEVNLKSRKHLVANVKYCPMKPCDTRDDSRVSSTIWILWCWWWNASWNKSYQFSSWICGWDTQPKCLFLSDPPTIRLVHPTYFLTRRPTQQERCSHFTSSSACLTTRGTHITWMNIKQTLWQSILIIE